MSVKEIMTKIKPFKAIVYNQEKVRDLSKVVCPPYDVISPAKQQYYHELDSHNLIHILLGKDIPGENKYQRSAQYFKDWLNKKILIEDDQANIYLYSQEYKIRAEKKTRFGLIALLSLDDKRSLVFGHEHTHLEPKADRLNLIREVNANLSPIFVLFKDKKRVINKAIDDNLKKKPFIVVTDDEKVIHKIWRLDSLELLDQIQESLDQENVFIADGHHRYEVACAYRNEVKEKLKGLKGDESFNHVLAYFTNTESQGLSILPIHRLVELGGDKDIAALRESLKEYFSVEEVKDRMQFFFLMQKAGRTEHVLGMYAKKKFSLLRAKNIKLLDKLMNDKPREYRSLDVSILNAVVFNKILGLTSKDKEKITFSPNADEFVEAVDAGGNYVAFFLNPVKVEQITSVALLGEKMPPKSTYFYPKVLSGLLIHKHQDI